MDPHKPRQKVSIRSLGTTPLFAHDQISKFLPPIPNGDTPIRYLKERMAFSSPTKLHITTKSLAKTRSFPSSSHSLIRSWRKLIIALFAFLALFQLQIILRTLKIGIQFSLPSSMQLHLLPRGEVAFLPLKDLRLAHTPMDGNTWFMSSLNDTYETGETEYLHFPSDASKGRLLCLAGRSISNGTMNSYALALPHDLPRYAKLLSGLTFVSDTYYDYENLWHGLSAVVPFAAWHRRKGCAMPARWVLYHRGELRSRMGTWVSNVTAATFGQETNIERFERSDDGPSCFEEAVVFRHNEGKMTRESKVKVYDMMRCKARAYCNVSRKAEDLKNIRMTLFFRVGARAFKDEEGVTKIFERECKEVKGCQVKVARPNNLTFCDQVKLMSETDVLVSSHGAQLTNMFFMDKNSSIMEFYPKGWRELAGAGQYVYRWLASYSGMAHRGAWYDPNGDPCPYNVTSRCMSFYKNKLIGHDEALLTNWTMTVLKEERQRKLSINGRELKPSSCDCDMSN